MATSMTCRNIRLGHTHSVSLDVRGEMVKKKKEKGQKKKRMP